MSKAMARLYLIPRFFHFKGGSIAISQDHKTKALRLLAILLASLALTTIIFIPFFINSFSKGLAFAGKGDGFSQLIPFQKYLYHQYTHFRSFYDVSFGLGGDYTKSLSYYYATSPIILIYFFFIWIGEQLFHLPTHDIKFWAGTQIFLCYIRVFLTVAVSYYLFRYLINKRTIAICATLMYAISVVTIYFNFTWSFYGDVLIFFPLSLLGMERFFRERKIGLFIIAVALTLFSNFYFSYYEFITLGFYFLYRIIWPYRKDVVNRVQKVYVLAIAAVLSLMVSIVGFYTGVSGVMANDRQINPNLKLSWFIDFQEKYHIFSDGFYITISMLTFVALCAFNLYKYYFYRLSAIVTWIMLIGSLTPYFDSFFNGFSLPARRWIYLLGFSSSLLIALFIKHLAEVSIKQFVITCALCVCVMLYMFTNYDGDNSFMIVTFIIMLFMYVLLQNKELLTMKYTPYIMIGLIFIQQAVMIKNYHDTHMDIYERPIASMEKDNYNSEKLQKQFDHLQKTKDPFSRIEYLSFPAQNSPLIYGFRGVALYSSLFNGDVLDYYDNIMQIQQPIDKNSNHRFLGNRANLMALWNVQDRFKNPPDTTMPYGFKTKKVVEGNEHKYKHSESTIDYPATHITDKVYDKQSLKTPIDREHAMLKGVVLDHPKTTTPDIEHNVNLKDDIKEQSDDADWEPDDHTLHVKEKNGGIDYEVPDNIKNKYKDLYFEMELELKSPDKPHKVKLNEARQQRSSLNYSYRRVVNPITIRVKADDKVRLNLQKGKYKYQLKGVYGEDYKTLKSAAKEEDKVKIKQTDHGYRFTKDKNDKGYLVVPTPYEKGMKAKADGEDVEVKKGNGIQTVIPVKKGQEQIELSYTPPHLYLLLFISLAGIILSIFFTRFVYKKGKPHSQD
ncbi:YfhO family protein [Staphylococcus sp. IVB6181]|uniref:YfhO family protein n=1 Tax=Staphylococcus sp. IVB6181 TaxID=2929481 RepID=UPI0021D26FC3|nr:YfhO family protein [Staphylococcus sp. IVB6181]